MADKPWKGRNLTPGQIAQRLQNLGCSRFYDKGLPDLPNSQAWKAPTGEMFWVSLAECDDIQVEGIVAEIEKWAKKKR